MGKQLTDAEKEAARKKASDEEARRKAQGADDSDDEEDSESDDDEGDSGNDLGWTKEQKAYVDGLRKESAKYRTKSKELESGLKSTNERLSKFEGGLKKLFGDDGDDSNLTTEQRIERLEKRNQQEKSQREEESQQLALANALKDAALEHGVSKQDFEFFEYLMTKKLATLEDDQELSDKDVAQIAKQAKSRSASRSTSVDDDAPNPDEEDGDITVEEFMEMGIGARSALYQKDKGLYEKLLLAEKSAKRKK